jgi:RND family efflux transporter MFP subunit
MPSRSVLTNKAEWNLHQEQRFMAKEDLSKLKIDKEKVGFRAGRSRKGLYLVLIVLGLLSLGLLYRAGFLTPPLTVQASTVTQVYPSQAFTVLTASGYVVPQRKSALASKVTGRLVWLGVEEGNRVKKGQIVARLESEDVVATRDQAAANLATSRFNLEQAKAELADATLSLNRVQELVEKDFVARAEYDTAMARYRKAGAAVKAAEATVRASEAAWEAAKIQVEYTLIRAPFDAVVLTKNADIGDIVTPFSAATESKSAVITIADMGSLQVEADVSESSLSKVRIGQPCQVQLDALPGKRFRGTVHMIVPTGDRTKAAVMVKIRFIDQDSRILPEMSAKVSFLSRSITLEDDKARTAVSRQALIDRNGQKMVFRIQGDRVSEIPLEIGSAIGDMVEVVDGLQAGDQVVLNPPKRLIDGAKIKIGEI